MKLICSSKTVLCVLAPLTKSKHCALCQFDHLFPLISVARWLHYVNLEGVERVCESLRAGSSHNIDFGSNCFAERCSFGSSIARG